MSERRGCFKIGCLGCGGLAALTVVIVILLLVVGLVTGGRESRMEEIDRSQPVSFAMRAPSARGDAAAGIGTIDREIEVAEPGRIVLDLNRGNFEIVPGAEGEPLRLELEAFVEAVHTRATPHIDGRQARRAIELAHRVRESIDASPFAP